MNPEDAKQLIETSGQLQTTYLGSRSSKLGVEENIGVDDQKRLLHTLVIGPTGSGKTQVSLHTMLQDIHKGHGLCFINPKGNAIDQLLAKIPEDRLEDVIYLNPAGDRVPAINVLEPYITEDMTQAQRENQKEIIVSDIIDLFKRQSENWGDRFGRILETLLRAHLDLNIHQNESRTLLDVFQSIINTEKLSQLIDETGDPVVREQLVRIHEDMGTYELEPLQRRLNDFVMNPTIRNVISQGEDTVNFREAVNQGKIVLVDIQKGEVGETVSELVGSIVITQVWAAAQSRINQDGREPFHLYVDELQNFAGEGSNFTKVLAEAREYGLSCWLITQYLRQLAVEMRRAVANNCRNKLVFNPAGSDDTSQIAAMFQGIDKTQLKALGNYRAALQTTGNGEQRKAVILDTYPPWQSERETREIKAKASARQTPETGIQLNQSLGQGNNAGGDIHATLLKQGKEELEERGFTVNLLYQDAGDEKPDGHVHLPGNEIAHLEAEHTTLSKPGKVLENLSQATQNDREVIFIVQTGNAAKLKNIVSDPFNRRGTDHEDEHGTYSYYQNNGEPYTQVDDLEDAEYRILELTEENLTEHQTGSEPECPELDQFDKSELENFCIHREDDGHCNALGQTCVILGDD